MITKKENIPPSLFKYRDFDINDHYKKLLTNNELFFSSPSNFNDPFDCRVYPDYELGTDCEIKERFFQHTIEANPTLSKNQQRLIANKAFKENIDIIRSPKKMMHRMNDIIDNSFGVCSMAEVNDNLLMWAHYSNKHRGFCIELDAHELYDIGSNYLQMLNEVMIFYKVEYTNVHPRINPYLSYVSNDLIKWITTKSSDWNYEREWRLIYFKMPDEPVSFPDRIIKAIYFGAKCSEVQMKKCIELLKRRKSLPEMYKAKLNHKEFGVTFEGIKV